MFRKLLLASTMLVAAAATVTTASAAQETLRLGHYFTTSDFRGRTAQYFADRVNKLAPDLNVEVYPNESLVKGRDALQATAQGTVDLYSLYAGYVAGQAPIVNIFSLPFPPKSYDDAAMYSFASDPKTKKILDSTFARFGVKYLGVINSTGPAQIFMREPIKGIGGLDGKKMRGAGGLSDDALRKLGASVVMLSAAEQFLALQTGTVDGMSTTWSSYVNNDLAQVAPTYLEATLVRGPYLLIMNKAKYDALSDTDKKAVQQAVDETVAWSRDNFGAEQKELHAKMMKQAKHVVDVSPAEDAKLRKEMQPIYQSYVDNNGKDGAALMAIWKKDVGAQ